MLGGEELASAVLDEEAGQLEVALLAGGLPELDECELDLGMAAIAQSLAGAERRVDVVGQLGGDGEEVGLARGPVVGDGRLDHVPRAVELVVVAKVGPPPSRLFHDVVAVEIAVGELGRGQLGDDLVDPLLQNGIGMRGERVRGGLEGLVHVRIHEDRAREAAGGPGCGQLQVLEIARFLEHLEVHRNRHGPVDFLARAPERVTDLHVREWHRAELDQAHRRPRLTADEEACEDHPSESNKSSHDEIPL